MKTLILAAAATLLMCGGASAGDARCFTTDDGDYPCAFEVLDDAGSFRISADGKPTFELWVDAPGLAFVGATFEADGRSVALPGTYVRSTDDGACWVSDATDAKICAW